ncbi:zinc finger protein 182-like isoform X2 [Pleurodeles waltl]|uniref:zinc finger protein 182-like isoform X2 n=1 Tax=Pleurodeles waltl TaxID=8319 RepID=UPI00370964A1
MARRQSDKIPVTSYDAASLFSEEEWKLLHEWQKDLYKNVMTEIHQALIALGPLIATTVFTLRAKEKEDLCHLDQEDCHLRQNIYCSPRSMSLPSDDGLNRGQVSEVCLVDHRDGSDGLERSPDLRSGHEDGIITLNIKEEEEFYPVFHQEYERRENINCSTGSPSDNSESVLMIMDDRGDEGEERTTSGHEHIFKTPVVSFFIKEEEEEYSMASNSTERRECVSSRTGDGGMKRNSQKEGSPKHAENIPTCKVSLRKSKANAHQCSEKGTHSLSHLWTETNQEMRGHDTDLCGRDFSNEIHSSVHQGTHKATSSYLYNEPDGILRNTTLVTYPQKTSRNWRQYISTEFAQNASKNGPINVQRADIRKRPFQCPKCKKSFIQKRHLNRHLNIHTGERPYQCTECGKSFIQKQHFIGHQRIHTGERPYQCSECDKSYTLKQCLIIHQRKHTQEKAFQYTEHEKRFSQKQNLIMH